MCIINYSRASVIFIHEESDSQRKVNSLFGAI